MACFQCKMCGGTLQVQPGDKVAVCSYCGNPQTLPRLTSDNITALYERAGHFRRNNEFDKAADIYEQILQQDTTDAEAYWSLVLCSYGVEYVEDARTHQRKITINRVQYTSVFDDENYAAALRYADVVQRDIYQKEAETINNIQKHYLQISAQEAPFDVFICYKESDDTGKRTPDSVLAQDLYYELTELGYKVFFARITLEDKLGTAYEPYIFAALNSAKVMVVLGTKPEYFNAVWVRNEWSRFLALIKNGAKKMLVPAYRDMDPYDLPPEFSHLQAQNMSKLGFMQDLVRGIRKIVGGAVSEVDHIPAAPAANSAVAPLLKRIELFLSDGMYREADEYCEKVLDMDPENGQVYVSKLLAQLRISSVEDLQYQKEPFDSHSAYRNALRFADAQTAEKLIHYNKLVQDRAQRAAEEARRKQQEENFRRQQEQLRWQQEQQYRQQNMQWQSRQDEIRRQITSLEDERNSKIGKCVLWFIFFWPVGVGYLFKILGLSSRISSLRSQLR